MALVDSEEFRLKIEAYSPETMPMARLAEYLGELAEMLGESASVHFVKLEPGSTSVVHKIKREAIPKIRQRTRTIARGLGARDAVRAYERINRMVREDNGRAVWSSTQPDSDLRTEIVVFPGKDEAQTPITSVNRAGSVDGEVLRVGGVQKLIPILLRNEDREIAGCYAARDVAKDLAKRLFEPVRLFGVGRWYRNDEGVWNIDTFKVNSFISLSQASSTEAFAQLRTMNIGWDKDSFDNFNSFNGESEDMNDSV